MDSQPEKGRKFAMEPALSTKLIPFQLSIGISPLYLVVSTKQSELFFGIWVTTKDEFTMRRRKG